MTSSRALDEMRWSRHVCVDTAAMNLVNTFRSQKRFNLWLKIYIFVVLAFATLVNIYGSASTQRRRNFDIEYMLLCKYTHHALRGDTRTSRKLPKWTASSIDVLLLFSIPLFLWPSHRSIDWFALNALIQRFQFFKSPRPCFDVSTQTCPCVGKGSF